MNSMSEDRYWQAVLARDRTLDGCFVYAVQSTGIYCRPTCPSRRPAREQVVFFAQPSDAEAAHFRACLRCHPRRMPDDAEQAVVRKACALIEARDEGAIRLGDLSEALNVHPDSLRRMFKAELGVTPGQYARAFRLERLKRQLQEGNAVISATYDVGFGSSSRLYEQAPLQLGMTPAVYRRGGDGMRIGYTIVDSPHGRLLVAATDRGICAVSMGDSDDTLVADLHREYPAAEIRHEAHGLGQWVTALLRHLEGRQTTLDLPLDLQETAFRCRVRMLLQRIPFGATRSYGELARELGQPAAARAVARVCASNPVALVVPCHRVVREDGTSPGYRWGLGRKQALLEQERRAGERQSDLEEVS